MTWAGRWGGGGGGGGGAGVGLWWVVVIQEEPIRVGGGIVSSRWYQLCMGIVSYYGHNHPIIIIITSESLKDLMCLGTTWYQLESCRGHGSCLTLYYDCKTC